jgi:CTD small phosphatase-like protein 2
VKDLRVINRDLSQTVLIDNAAYSYAFQIDNGIPIIPYYEGKVDFELKALQTYLETLSFCKDVREMNRNAFSLYRYTEFDNP